MSKLTKNQKIAYAKVEAGKLYKLPEAAALLKEINVDLSFNNPYNKSK